MAISNNTDQQPAFTAPTGAGAAPDASAYAAAPGIAPQAPGGLNLTSLISMFNRGQLGQGEQEYVETLKKVLPLNFEVVQLSQPVGAQAVIFQGHAVVLIFADAIGSVPPDFVPYSQYMDFAANSLNMLRPGTRIIAPIVVTREDYPLAAKMGSYIASALTVVTDPQYNGVTMSVFSAETEYQIDKSVESCRNFVANYHPHAVQPRIDVGLVISTKRPRQPGQPQGMLDDTMPILAVGGYTELVRSPAPDPLTNEFKFMPFFRITAVVSPLLIPAMALLGITAATDVFIRQRGWIDQFRSFMPGRENLGQLSPDPSDAAKLWFASNEAELQTWIARNCTAATPLIDIVEGQARIPFLVNYVPGTAQPGKEDPAKRVMDNIHQFFGVVPNMPQGAPLTAVQNFEYIGSTGPMGGLQLDSRTRSYLSLVAEKGALAGDAEILLHYKQEPRYRAAAVHNLSTNFRSLYTCYSLVPNAYLLMFLSEQFRNRMRVAMPGARAGDMSLDFALAQGHALASGFSSMVMDPRSTLPGFGSYYGAGW